METELSGNPGDSRKVGGSRVVHAFNLSTWECVCVCVCPSRGIIANCTVRCPFYVVWGGWYVLRWSSVFEKLLGLVLLIKI